MIETGTEPLECALAKSDIMFTRGKIAQSVELEEKSFSIVQDIAEKNPTDKNQGNLAASYGRMGNRLEVQGKLDSAMEMYQKSLEIHEKLCAKLGTAEWQRALAVSYGDVGNILESQGDLSGAIEMNLAHRNRRETCL